MLKRAGRYIGYVGVVDASRSNNVEVEGFVRVARPWVFDRMRLSMRGRDKGI
jgi:hypothetical protein